MTTMDVGARIGPYEILRKIGTGGMGAVYEAVHQAIERRVAIKILHPESARSPEIATRFLNEARAVNRISHPSMVQISDLGQLPDGAAYLVMELLVGEPLNVRLRRLGGRLPLVQALDLGSQIADALSAAHDKGIIHRDPTPLKFATKNNSAKRGGKAGGEWCVLSIAAEPCLFVAIPGKESAGFGFGGGELERKG